MSKALSCAAATDAKGGWLANLKAELLPHVFLSLLSTL